MHCKQVQEKNPYYSLLANLFLYDANEHLFSIHFKQYYLDISKVLSPNSAILRNNTIWLSASYFMLNILNVMLNKGIVKYLKCYAEQRYC